MLNFEVAGRACDPFSNALNGLTLRIDGVDMKHVLGQIEADNNNLLGHGTTLLDVASDIFILHT